MDKLDALIIAVISWATCSGALLVAACVFRGLR